MGHSSQDDLEGIQEVAQRSYGEGAQSRGQDWQTKNLY